MNKKTLPIVTIAAAASLLFGVAAPAFAAESTPSGVVIAQAGQVVGSAPKQVALSATPTQSGAITVTAAPQSTVTMVSGKTKITRTTNSAGKAVFTKLTPGKDYTFTHGKHTITSRALTTTAPVSRLTVLTTKTPDSVAVSWDHASSRKTGGADTTYAITATPQNNLERPTTLTTKNTAVVLSGLNPDVIYSFTVTPSNAIGTGPATTATMKATLRSLSTSDQPVAREVAQVTSPASVPTPAPVPLPAPTPVPTPGTRTIYVCPDTFTEVGGACQKTEAYTYSYLPYTFHTETTNLPYTYHTETTNLPYTYHTVQTGPAPLLDSFETQSVCPAGYNLEDYGAQGKFCRLYGTPPTAQVKDAPPAGYADNGTNYTKSVQVKDAPPAGYTDNGTNYTKSVQVKDAPPAGYTDNGTRWVKKNAAPAGYTDNGTEYIATASKIAKVVPA